MARKPRIEFPGAIYHVMSRGNRQEPIFLDDKDCAIFMNTLGEACKKTGWLVHAFVLMGNHYHLLLETPEANLVTGMKWLQGTYTQRFNSRHKLRGHLLQGRYKALLIDGEGGDYFPTVGAYIHLNPARAHLFDLVKEPLEQFSWSSYPLFLQPEKRPEWFVVDRLLGALGVEDNSQGLEWFREYMRRRVEEVASNQADDPEWETIRRGWCFGSKSFQGAILAKMDAPLRGHDRASYNGEEIRKHDEVEAERYLIKGLEYLGLDDCALSSLPKGAREKAALAWLVRANTTVSRRWLASRLMIGDESRVSRMAGEVERSDSYAELKNLLSQITRFTD